MCLARWLVKREKSARAHCCPSGEGSWQISMNVLPKDTLWSGVQVWRPAGQVGSWRKRPLLPGPCCPPQLLGAHALPRSRPCSPPCGCIHCKGHCWKGGVPYEGTKPQWWPRGDGGSAEALPGASPLPHRREPPVGKHALVGGLSASPEDRSLCVRRKLMASRMMDALSRWELTLCGRGSSWASS